MPPGFTQGAEAKGKHKCEEGVSPFSKAMVALERFRGAHGSSVSFANGKSLLAPLRWFLWWLPLLSVSLQGELVFSIFLDAAQHGKHKCSGLYN